MIHCNLEEKRCSENHPAAPSSVEKVKDMVEIITCNKKEQWTIDMKCGYAQFSTSQDKEKQQILRTQWDVLKLH